jgi:hypothetical protein
MTIDGWDSETLLEAVEGMPQTDRHVARDDTRLRVLRVRMQFGGAWATLLAVARVADDPEAPPLPAPGAPVAPGSATLREVLALAGESRPVVAAPREADLARVVREFCGCRAPDRRLAHAGDDAAVDLVLFDCPGGARRPVPPADPRAADHVATPPGWRCRGAAPSIAPGMAGAVHDFYPADDPALCVTASVDRLPGYEIRAMHLAVSRGDKSRPPGPADLARAAREFLGDDPDAAAVAAAGAHPGLTSANIRHIWRPLPQAEA